MEFRSDVFWLHLLQCAVVNCQLIYRYTHVWCYDGGLLFLFASHHLPGVKGNDCHNFSRVKASLQLSLQPRLIISRIALFEGAEFDLGSYLPQ